MGDEHRDEHIGPLLSEIPNGNYGTRADSERRGTTEVKRVALPTAPDAAELARVRAAELDEEWKRAGQGD